MVEHMVSNFKIASFIVGVILSTVLPIYVLVKVRKEKGIMGNIVVGAIASLLVTLVKGLLVTLIAGILPTLLKADNLIINITLLFIFDLLGFLVVYWILTTKFKTESLTPSRAAATTLGYLLTFTWTNISTLMNFTIGGFAINEGNLVDYLNAEQIVLYTRAIVDTSAFHYLGFAIYIVFNWLLYTKLFQYTMAKKEDRPQVVIYAVLASFMMTLFSAKILPPVVLLVVILAVTLVMFKEFKAIEWN